MTKFPSRPTLSPLPTRYQVNRVLLAPRMAIKRRQLGDESDFMRAALEVSNFRRSAYGFIGATMEDQDILYTADIDAESTVIDVGAFVGKWAVRIADKYGAAVHAFELSPTMIPDLAIAFADYPSITLHAYGLGNRDSEIPICRKGLGSSAFAKEKASDLEWDVGKIRDVVAALDELDLTDVGLMKLNIEGGEYDLLERMIATDRLKSVDTFLIQFHEWLPRAHVRRRRIRKHLAQTHELAWDYPFVWEKWVKRAPQEKRPI